MYHNTCLSSVDECTAFRAEHRHGVDNGRKPLIAATVLMPVLIPTACILSGMGTLRSWNATEAGRCEERELNDVRSGCGFQELLYCVESFISECDCLGARRGCESKATQSVAHQHVMRSKYHMGRSRVEGYIALQLRLCYHQCYVRCVRVHKSTPPTARYHHRGGTVCLAVETQL